MCNAARLNTHTRDCTARQRTTNDTHRLAHVQPNACINAPHAMHGVCIPMVRLKRGRNRSAATVGTLQTPPSARGARVALVFANRHLAQRAVGG